MSDCSTCKTVLLGHPACRQPLPAAPPQPGHTVAFDQDGASYRSGTGIPSHTSRKFDLPSWGATCQMETTSQVVYELSKKSLNRFPIRFHSAKLYRFGGRIGDASPGCTESQHVPAAIHWPRTMLYPGVSILQSRREGEKPIQIQNYFSNEIGGAPPKKIRAPPTGPPQNFGAALRGIRSRITRSRRRTR